MLLFEGNPVRILCKDGPNPQYPIVIVHQNNILEVAKEDLHGWIPGNKELITVWDTEDIKYKEHFAVYLNGYYYTYSNIACTGCNLVAWKYAKPISTS